MADLNDLQREWDSQPAYPEAKMNEIAELVRTRSGRMRSCLFARDMRESIACVIIIVVFGAYWFFVPNAVAKTGCLITIAGAVEIMVLMQIVQRRGRADFTSVPLKEFVLSEVQVLNRQISLLRHVAWWYLLPLYVGCCVFVIGIGLDDDWDSGKTFAIWFCGGYFAFCVFLWWLNQHARRTTLEPLRDAMQQTWEGLSALDLAGESDPDARRSGDGPVDVKASDLRDVLANPALDARWRFVRFVRPSWHQIVVMMLACMGGTCGGVLIQQSSGEPMRYEEWPLLGLMVAGTFAFVSTCFRRTGKEE